MINAHRYSFVSSQLQDSHKAGEGEGKQMETTGCDLKVYLETPYLHPVHLILVQDTAELPGRCFLEAAGW